MVAIAKVAELLKDMYTYVGSDVHHDKYCFQSKNKSERHHPLQNYCQ
jgi:hypothetical protein